MSEKENNMGKNKQPMGKLSMFVNRIVVEEEQIRFAPCLTFEQMQEVERYLAEKHGVDIA